MEAPVTAVTVYHSNFKGTSADTWFGDELGGGSVSAWQGGTVQAPTATLNFSTYAVDPTSQVCVTESYCPKNDPGCTTPVTYEYCHYTRYSYEYGWGEVPAADFQVRGGTARLDTIVAPSPTFYIEHCDIDYGNPDNPYVCSSGAGGAITVAWTKDGVSSSNWTGTNRWNSGKYSFKSQGTGSWQSATAEGTLIGRGFANAGGSIAKSTGTSISKDVVSNPKPLH